MTHFWIMLLTSVLNTGDIVSSPIAAFPTQALCTEQVAEAIEYVKANPVKGVIGQGVNCILVAEVEQPA